MSERGIDLASSRLLQISGHLSDNRLDGSGATPEAATAKATGPPDVSASSPTLIIIIGFTGAPSKHLAPYVAHYAALYPNACAIVLESHFADMSPFPFSTRRSRERGFAEIFQALEATSRADSKETPMPNGGHRLLVHVFSGGGQSRFGCLAAAYRRRTGRLLPAHLLVLDSAPAPSRLWLKTVAAAAVLKVPRGRLGSVWLLPIVLWVALWAAWTTLTWQTDPLGYAFGGLNDPALVQRRGLRLYVFSKSDPITDWRWVAKHAEEARDRGYEVRELEVTGSGHVAHAKTDPKRYWKTIAEAWRDASVPVEEP